MKFFSKKRADKNASKARRISLEALEDRQLLTATPWVAAPAVDYAESAVVADAKANTVIELTDTIFEQENVPANLGVALKAPVFDLTATPFDNVAVSAIANGDGSTTAVLYGIGNAGSLVPLANYTFDAGADLDLTIFGAENNKEATLIATNATYGLENINYSGGYNGRAVRDTLSIWGDSLLNDTFTIQNGAGIIEDYAILGTGVVDVVGEINDILFDGATIRFSGVNDVFVDGQGAVEVDSSGDFYLGADTFDVRGTSSRFTFVANTDGSDSDLNFSNMDVKATEVGVTLNMNADYRQAALCGEIGSLRLAGAFDNVELSAGIDTIWDNWKDNEIVDFTTSTNTVHIKRGGGNYVELNGKSFVYADGEGRDFNFDGFADEWNTIVLGSQIYANSDYSIVTATGADCANNVWAFGDHISVHGGNKADSIQIDGDWAYVSSNGGDDFINIVGERANVVAGAGNDFVGLEGDWATINGNNGDDTIDYAGSNGHVYGGEGNDDIYLYDIETYNDNGELIFVDASNDNWIYGQGDDDAIDARWSIGTNNRFYGGAGADAIFGSQGADWIYGEGGTDVLIGFSGADWIDAGSSYDFVAGDIFANAYDSGYIRDCWISGDFKAFREALGDVTDDLFGDDLFRGSGDAFFLEGLGDDDNALGDDIVMLDAFWNTLDDEEL